MAASAASRNRRVGLLLATIGIAVAACGSPNPPGPATPSPSPSPSPSATSLSRCFDAVAVAKAPDYMGLTETEARGLAAKRSDHLAVVSAEGRCLPRVQPMPAPSVLVVNVALANGRVVDARSGHYEATSAAQ